METHELRRVANRIRRRDLQAVFEAGAGHIGGEMSAIDLLTALYFRTLNVDPTAPRDPDRDRFVLSKGHTACALYVTLAEAGFISKDEISTFLKPHSRLNGHPNCTKVPGVETNTGPLGHGLPVAVGMAKAAQMGGASWRTFVLTGDGELQEGSNWEAAMAAAQFGLDNLTLIVDHNRLQQGARLADTNDLAPLRPRFEAFGWAVEEIDGHDMEAIVAALAPAARVPGKPKCVIAHTHKGQGISFMQDRVEWHHKVPSREQYEQAKKELEEAIQ
jgi:transketolase